MPQTLTFPPQDPVFLQTSNKQWYLIGIISLLTDSLEIGTHLKEMSSLPRHWGRSVSGRFGGREDSFSVPWMTLQKQLLRVIWTASVQFQHYGRISVLEKMMGIWSHLAVLSLWNAHSTEGWACGFSAVSPVTNAHSTGSPYIPNFLGMCRFQIHCPRVAINHWSIPEVSVFGK